MIYKMLFRSLAVVTLTAITCSVVVTSNSLFAHPQQKEQDQLTVDERKQLATARKLDQSVDALFDKEEFAAAIKPARQARVIWEEIFGTEHPDTAASINALAVIYDSLGNYEAAEPLYKQVLAIRKKILGDEHPDTLVSLSNLALFFEDQNDFATAKPLHLRYLSTVEKTFGTNDRETAIALQRLGRCCEELQRYADAQKYYQRALAVFEATAGSNSVEAADSMNSLAVVFQHQKQDAAAEPLLKRALKIYEKQLGPEDLAVANCLNNLAALYSGRKHFAISERLYKRQLTILEKQLGAMHPDRADVLENLATDYSSQGKYESAQTIYEQLLVLNEQLHSVDSSEFASALNNLGVAHERLGNYAKAERFHQRALKIREQVLGASHAITAVSLNNLANVYNSQARFEEALELYARALQIDEMEFGPDHVETAMSLYNTGRLHTTTENYTAAEPLLLRALAIREKVLGRNHSETADSLIGLGILKHQLGSHAEAELLYRKALKIRKAVLGPDHPGTSISISNLALVLSDQSKYAEAEPLYRSAVRTLEETTGANHPGTISVINNFAGMYHAQGDYPRAEDLQRRVLGIRERVLGPDHPDTATTLSDLAFSLEGQGDHGAAAQLFRHALAIREKTLGVSHPETLLSQQNVALHEARNGNHDVAGQLIDRARRGTRTHVAKILPALSERQQKQFLSARYQFSYHIALSVGLANRTAPGMANLSAAWVINGKAVAQEALAQRNLLARDSRDPKLAHIVEQLLRVRGQLANLAMSATVPNRIESQQDLIEKLISDEQALSHQLAAKEPDPNHIDQDWTALTRVQAALSEKSVLIDIARFEHYDIASENLDNPWQPARYVAWITYGTPGTNSLLIDLGDAVEIDALVAAARATITQTFDAKNGEGEERATATLNADLQMLGQKIWKPLEAHLNGIDQIVLSPDGALWLLPWNALPVGDERNQFLLEKYSLRMVISGRDLVKKSRAFDTQPAVILANPNFDLDVKTKQNSIEANFNGLPPMDDTTTRSFSAKSLLGQASPLPNTGLEAIAIRPSLETYAGSEVAVYDQQLALEHAVKLLSRPKVAAFATHGFFLPAQRSSAVQTKLWYSNPQKPSPVDRSGRQIENPLLRCGLLFSGCNHRDSVVGDDDGILTGLEIVGIDFRGTELVVLSACETGIGEIRNGEGVAGLRQAFQLAGAQSVVATLWQVPDRDSAVIMSDFFANLADGQSRADALRNAQIKRIEARRERFAAAHPFYWAAWTLTGE